MALTAVDGSDLLQTEKSGLPWVHCTLLGRGAMASQNSGAASDCSIGKTPGSSGELMATGRVKCTMVRHGESSYNDRAVELHFQHQQNRIGAKLPIE
jgi:hypothetical protein